MKKINLALITILAAIQSYAYQYAGGSITYTNLGGNKYVITLTAFVNCAGGSLPSTAAIQLSSTCGYNYTVVASQTGVANVNDTICSSVTNTCNGGSTPGFQKITYADTVTLPKACSDWIFSFEDCCRETPSVSNVNYSYYSKNIYLEAHLNNATAQNNSVKYNSESVIFACVNKPVCFNVGATDADGDSLSYSLIAPRTAIFTPVSYRLPYSYTNPLASSPSLTLNAATGDVCFKPTAQQFTMMTVLVQEYRAGILVGQTIRDYEIYTTNCTSVPPVQKLVPYGSNFQVVGGDTIKMCNSIKLDFYITYNDSNVLDNYQVTWNRHNLPPDATFTLDLYSNTNEWLFDWPQTLVGTYYLTVTLTDEHCNGTVDTSTVTYVIITGGLQAIVTDSLTGCNTYSATAYATGGTGPYQYYWSNGQNTQTVNGLPAGNYNSVEIRDGTGCTTTEYVTLPTSINLNIITTSASCNRTGTATANIFGGFSPFTYYWSNGQTTSTATNLTAYGYYYVTVTDALGCTATAYFSVGSGPSVSYPIVTDVSCTSSNDGSVTVSASGNGPFKYSWSNGKTTSTITGLPVGYYSVVVTDATGCTASQSVSVYSASSIYIYTSSGQTGCCSQCGTASVSPNGGYTPYTYLWSSGDSNYYISGLGNGTYKVTVTDAKGCTASGYVFVHISAAPTFSITKTNVKCNGGNNGSARVTGISGSYPFTYSWSNGSVAAQINNLSAQTYTVTLTDINGCTAAQSVTITQPPLLSLSVSTTSGCSGTATVSASGGVNPYSYHWSNGQNSTTAASLSSGTYFVTVTDANNCTASANSVITVTSTPAASINGVMPICNGQAISLTATGGTSYLWNSGQATDTLTINAAGIYSVIVTDNNGCTGAASITVTTTHLSLNFSRSYSICEAGSVMLTASGGTYFNWAPSTALSCTTCANPVASPLNTTTYTVTVSDGICRDTAMVTVSIDMPSPPSITKSGTDTLLCSHASTYQWYFNAEIIPNATDSFFVFSLCGNYSVYITDNNGCGVLSAGVRACLNVNETDVEESIIIYPNPATKTFTVYSLQFTLGQATISIFNTLGEKVCTLHPEIIHGKQTMIDVSNLANGIYMLELTNGNKSYRANLIKD